MKFSVLASGSAANAALVSDGKTKLLIDCGLPVRELKRRLALVGETIDDLTGVLLTHEHGDHQDGIAPLVRERIKRGNLSGFHVYANDLTAKELKWKNIEAPPIKTFRAGASFKVGDIGVRSFTVMHNAVDPSGFVLEVGGVRVGFATDLGSMPPALSLTMRGCDVVMTESNYDMEMMLAGDYHETVKERLLSGRGHLSNDQVFKFILEHLKPGVKRLILGHISTKNNTEKMVYSTAQNALSLRGFSSKLTIASQALGAETIEL